MLFRKWVVRGLVALVLAGCLCAGMVYQQWTNPAAVRQQVVDMLQKQFPGATVTLDGARWRILDGVGLTDLRLKRHIANQGEGVDSADDDRADVVHIPQASVYLNKEKLLDGHPSVQRIKMDRPLIRIIRNKDGKWNVEGLTGKSDASVPLPTIVIDKGTLVIEDRSVGCTWELHDLNLSLVNESANCLSFNGAGQSETMGEMAVSGMWNRATNATTLTFHTANLLINKELVRYVASQYADDRLKNLRLDGAAEIDAKVDYQPGAVPALTYDVQCQLRQTRVEHPGLPVPVYNLSASLHCTEVKLTLEKLKAAAGAGKIECHGSAELADPENNFSGELTAYYLPLTKDLAERLPPRVKLLYEKFNAVGTGNAHLVGEKQKGKWVRAHGTFEPDDLGICFEKFKYPLEHLTGVVDFDNLLHQYKFELIGYSGTQPIAMRGKWKGVEDESDALIVVTGQNIALDEKVLDALPGDRTTKPLRGLPGLATSFHATGRGSFRAEIRRNPGDREFHNTFQIHFSDSAVKWDEFPLALDNVVGDLWVYPRQSDGVELYEFKNFKGTHNGGEVLVQGGTLPRAGGKSDGKLIVDIAGQGICLDSDLQTALETPCPGLGETWKQFAPAGKVNFQAHVEGHPGRPRAEFMHEMDIGVDVAACAFKPNFFRYALDDVTGKFRYHNNKVELTNFTASHNNTRMSISQGTVDLFKGGGFYVQLNDLRANPLMADQELMTALPQGLSQFTKSVHLENQVVAITTNLVISKPPEPLKPTEVFWDGVMWLRDAELAAGIELHHVNGTLACRGLHDGRRLVGLCGNVALDKATILQQPFADVRGHFGVDEHAPDVMLATVSAPIFDGNVSGQARVEFNSADSSLRGYEVDLTASQIPLEEFGRHNLGQNQQLAGMAAGRLHLQGKGGADAGFKSLEGNGSIDVPYSSTTRLLNLPLLLDLLKFLGLRWPDRTFFEEAHAAFAVQGNRVSIGRLDLQGNVISLYGSGEVNLDGTDLQLDMYSSWGRAEQLLPSVVRCVPSAISKQLLRIEVRGKVGGDGSDLKFSKRLVPGLVDPLADFGNRVMGFNYR
jgi:hypothetical protein